MAKGKKSPAELPEYGTVMMKGVQYYRTRITDADGKRVAIYGLTREELYDRVEDAQKKIAEVVFQRENPTVEEYCDVVWNGKTQYVGGIRADGEKIHRGSDWTDVYGRGDHR